MTEFQSVPTAPGETAGAHDLAGLVAQAEEIHSIIRWPLPLGHNQAAEGRIRGTRGSLQTLMERGAIKIMA